MNSVHIISVSDACDVRTQLQRRMIESPLKCLHVGLSPTGDLCPNERLEPRELMFVAVAQDVIRDELIEVFGLAAPTREQKRIDKVALEFFREREVVQVLLNCQAHIAFIVELTRMCENI